LVNWLITLKLLSNDVTESPDGTVALPPPPEDDGVLLLPHAAATPATPITAPHRVSRVTPLEPVFIVRIAGSSSSLAR
jgi:hypothetical protein